MVVYHVKNYKMKKINDNITTIATSQVNVTWPITNTRDIYSENYYKSPINTALLTMQLGAPTLYANELFVSYTNATTADITIKELGGSVISTESGVTINNFDYFNYVTDTTPLAESQIWYSYTNPLQEHTIELDMTTTRVSSFTITSAGTGYSAGTFVMSKTSALNCTGRYNVNSSGGITELIIEGAGEGYASDGSTGEITGETVVFSNPGSGVAVTPYSHLQVGIVRGGFSPRYKNPTLGLTEGLKDLGNYLPRPDGTEYIVPGRILRTFSGTLDLTKDDSALVYSALTQMRRIPAAINLLDNDSAYICFGKTTSLPTMKRNGILRKQLNFTIQEM